MPALNALLSERSVTRAAEILCVSQPAMSGALQRLRDHFGDPLLVRSGREMELTPRAQALVDPVRELVLRTRALLEGGPDFTPGSSGRRFSIAASDYTAMTILPVVMGRLLKEAPGVSLAVEPLMGAAYERLGEGELDLIITAEDPRLDYGPTAHLRRQTLFTDHFVCVAAADNPKVGDFLTEEAFRTLPHAIVRFGGTMTSIEDDTLNRLGMNVPVALVAASFGSLLYSIPGTEMICTVQSRLAQRLQPILPIRILAPPVAFRDLTESLVWHPRSEKDDGHTWLRGLIHNESARLVAAAI